MVQESNGEAKRKEKLDPLPSQDDEFWKEAENEICTLKEITCANAKHEFIQKKSMEAKCVKCPSGYPLPVGGIVREGHIYIGETLVI